MKTLQVRSIKHLRNILDQCSGKTIALDTETTGLYWWNNHLTTLCFHCPSVGVEGTIDIGREIEDDTNDPELLQFEKDVRKAIKDCLKPGTTVIMHNSKFDMGFMDVDPETCYGWKIIDTPVLIHLIDSRDRKSLDLAEKKYLGTTSKREHVAQAPTNPKIKKKVWLWPPEVRHDYGTNDARVTYQLAVVLSKIVKELDLWELFTKDMAFLKIVYKTERYGWLTDMEYITKSKKALDKHRVDLERMLWDSVGYEFNWRSPKQLSKALYHDMGIDMPVNPFTADAAKQRQGYKTELGFQRVMELKSGQYNKYNTSTFILMEKAHHPLGELVAALREAAKLARQLEQWTELMDSEGVIRTNFNITGTRTGRLSSSKPNLANIPSDVRGRFTQGVFSGGTERTEEYNLRKGYVARPGKILVAVDYKQMEMRMFGIISQDKNMVQALSDGVDIHLYIAHKVWGPSGEKQDKIHREWSKTIGFGLIYGMTGGSLEHKLGMTKAQAKQVISDYWGAFPRIRPWLKETIATCMKYGYVRYWSKRIWREEEEIFMYKGANALVQGGCADLLGVAGIRLNKWLVENKMGTIISFIYDEMIVECDKDKAIPVYEAMMDIMQVPDLFGIPFFTDGKIGNSYGTLEEYKPKGLKA